MFTNLNSPKCAKGHAMDQAATNTSSMPATGETDAEVLAFRAGFESQSPLDEIVRQGAQRMLQNAIHAEVDAFL